MCINARVSPVRPVVSLKSEIATHGSPVRSRQPAPFAGWQVLLPNPQPHPGWHNSHACPFSLCSLAAPAWRHPSASSICRFPGRTAANREAPNPSPYAPPSVRLMRGILRLLGRDVRAINDWPWCTCGAARAGCVLPACGYCFGRWCGGGGAAGASGIPTLLRIDESPADEATGCGA